MCTFTEAPPGRILSVVSTPRQNGQFDPIGDFASHTRPLEVESIDNVYLALGRLVRSQARPYLGVFVQVDGLDVEELEFFSQAARLFPTLVVYAYAVTPAGRERTSLAVALGARGRVQAENLQEVWQHLAATGSMRVARSEATAAAARAENDGRPVGEVPSAPSQEADRRAAAGPSVCSADLATAFP